MAAAAWVLYAWFASDWDRDRLGFATGEKGLRIARVLYGLALIPFGLAHFVYLKQTARWCLAGCRRMWPGHISPAVPSSRRAWGCSPVCMPGWQPLFRRCRLACSRCWCGYPLRRHANAFQWSETVVSALTAGAWVVADSYRGIPWFAVGKR